MALWASAIAREMARPNPVPRALVVTNGLKICSIMSSGIPQPVSETEPPPWTDQGPEPRVPRQHPWSERVLAQVWVPPQAALRLGPAAPLPLGQPRLRDVAQGGGPIAVTLLVVPTGPPATVASFSHYLCALCAAV